MDFFNEGLQLNRSVLTFDMRGNQGYTMEVKKALALYMLKNIEHALKRRENVK